MHLYAAGIGYTGPARRGYCFTGASSGEPLETEPCPTCGKPCTVERYESQAGGRVLSVRRLWCPTQKRGRKTRFSDPTAGACPVHKEEVELTKKTDEHKVERDKMRELRKRLNLTNQRIGELADVSQGSLDHWLCGNVVSVDVAKRLAAVVARLEAGDTEGDIGSEGYKLVGFFGDLSNPAGGVAIREIPATLVEVPGLPPEAKAVLFQASNSAGSPERLREFEAAAGKNRVLDAVKLLAELQPAKQEAALSLLARLTEANRAEAELLEALAS